MNRLKKISEFMNTYSPKQDSDEGSYSQHDKDLMSMLYMLREDMKGEIENIEKYEMHVNSISEKEVRDLLIHILNEEREHSRELHQMIEKYEKEYDNIPTNNTLQEDNQ
jgi:rubrerythrin